MMPKTGSTVCLRFPYDARPARLLLWGLWALLGPLPGIAAAATMQDFNVPGTGTRCVPIQSDNPPPPELIPGGPIPDGGNFLRLASANPQPAPSSNTITCRTTDRGRFGLVVADFDFRMSRPPTPRVALPMTDSAFRTSPSTTPLQMSGAIPSRL